MNPYTWGASRTLTREALHYKDEAWAMLRRQAVEELYENLSIRDGSCKYIVGVEERSEPDVGYCGNTRLTINFQVGAVAVETYDYRMIDYSTMEITALMTMCAKEEVFLRLSRLWRGIRRKLVLTKRWWKWRMDRLLSGFVEKIIGD